MLTVLTVAEAITGRQSTRAYLNQPVPRDVLERVLTIASRAPSGSNIQPWRVWVLEGAAKDRLVAALMAQFEAGVTEKREYDYYPVSWRDPYLARRRACGFGLYKTLGIARDDKARMHEQTGKNYAFFGAPVGLIFSIDADLEKGSWLDYGMFVQSVMLAARSEGLETCPQAAFAYYPQTVHREVGIPADQIVVCGMAVGYPDRRDIVNTFRTEREPLDRFVTWVT